MDSLLNNPGSFLDSHIHFFDGISKTITTKSIVCSSSIHEWETISTLHNSIFIKSYGLHPWEIDSYSQENIEKLEKLLIHDKNSFLGEIGLDFCRDNKEQQEEIFCKQLYLANKHCRNIIIHSVKAWHRIIKPIELIVKDSSINIMFHGFNASEAITKKLIKKENYYFSFSPKSNLKGINLIPKNRLLVESDYNSNNSENYSDVFTKNITRISKEMEIDCSELLRLTTDNFHEFIR